MIQAIIFDMDGVLIDSPKYNWIAFNQILKRDYGIEISLQEKKERYLGKPLKDQLELIRADYQLEEEIDVSIFSEEAGRIQRQLLKDILKPNSKILSLIYDAKQQGIKVVVTTSSPRDRTEYFLKGLGVYDKLDAVLTCEDVIQHKPHPELYLETARKLGVSPENCVVFEDALSGVAAAKEAGMNVVGKVTGFHSAEELSHCDLVIEDFSEVSVKQLRDLVNTNN